MEDTDQDVIVIGAGISGLTAARFLCQRDSNLKVLVLEAKDRVGGRTDSIELKTKDGTDTWDIGGQWVGRCQPHIMSLIEELGLKTYRQYTEGRKFVQVGDDDKVSSYTSTIPTLSMFALLDIDHFLKMIDRLAQEIDPRDPYSCKNAELWDGMTLETLVTKHVWTKEANDLIRSCMRTVFGAELSHMSVLFCLMYVAAAGGMKELVEATDYTAQEYKIVGGAAQISQILLKDVGESSVILNEPVTSISQEDGFIVQVTGRSGNTYSCRKVILAIPPPQIGKITFHPILPVETREIIKRMPMCNYTKVIVTFPEAFWRTAGQSGEVVTNGGPSNCTGCDKGPLSIVYDATSSTGQPALVAFIAGMSVVQWQTQSEDHRKTAVLKSLTEFFGEKVSSYIHYVERDWDFEPFQEGSPICCVGPGAMKYLVKGLRHPFKSIHFAGTETATVWCGYMNGAVQAGRRAALEVLYDLRPQLMDKFDLQELRSSQTRGHKRQCVKIPPSFRTLLLQLFMAISVVVIAVLIYWYLLM